MKYKIIKNETFDMETFREVSFLGAEFDNCIFMNCDFLEAFLTGVIFRSCEFYGCNFDKAYIFRSQFKDCQLVECSFSEETLMSTVDFSGTTFVEVTYNGLIITKPPLIIDGIEYPIVALDNGHMQVGCEFNTYDWFYETDEKESARMEGLKARRFWKRNKTWIFQMLAARKLYVRTND
jgi:uncharacterized protein YjbI with pentapeptide repeats